MIAPGLLRWGDVAIGAAVRTGENAVGAISRLRSQWTRWEGRRARWESEAHGLRHRLAERGAAERGHGMHVMDEALTSLATSPLFDRIVGAQLERVLRLLEDEPERIRALVRGQRTTMVDEVVGRVRAGAAAGDEAVEKFALKMGRREPTDSR